MHLSGFDFFLWATGFVEMVTLMAVLLVRHRVSRFPFFTAWIALSVVRTIALYFVYRFGSADAYFYSFWTLGFMDLLIQFGIICELAAKVFRPLGAWAPGVRSSFAVMIAFSILIAAALTWLASPATHKLRTTIVIRGNFFASALFSELFVAMVALSVTLGLPWRTHVARIAQGMGIYSILSILTDTALTCFGTTGNAFTRITRVRIGFYLLCSIYWIISLARDEPKPRQLPENIRLELLAIQQRASLVLQGFRGLGRAS